MTKDEALKMAIEALEQYIGVVQHKVNAETWGDIEDGGKPAIKAIQACKDALKQQPQAPVAWMSEGGVFTRTKDHAESWSNHGGKVTPVYTHPAPSWQGLSDDEIDKLYADWERGQTDYLNYARAIEQALKEKNTCS